MNIRLLSDKEKPPMDLLVLADPSPKMVEEYLKEGESYIAESDNQLIEIYEKYCRQQELSQIACIKKELTNRSTLIKFSLTFWVHYIKRDFFESL